MDFFTNVVGSYGYDGLALIVLLLLFFGIQFYYYGVVYRRIPRYRINMLPVRRESEPPVSVVIVTQEDMQFVEERLPMFLTQDYSDYEVVLVYVGSNEDFLIELSQVELRYPRLRVITIRQQTRFPISNKQALNFGIKASRYEHILFSTSDTLLTSDRWLRLMARGFTRADIVLGYCGVEYCGGLGNRLMRTQRLAESMQWLSWAVRGRAYRGIRNSMGFTKSVYMSVKGFNHLNMNMGEDDLFIGSLAASNAVCVIMSPRATVRQKAWGGLSWWLGARRYFGHTFRYYGRSVRNFVEREGCTRLLFFLTAAAAMAFMPDEIRIAAAVVVLLRYGIVVSAVNAVRRRLGEKHVMVTYFIHDLLGPVTDGILALSRRMFKDETVWR